MPAKLAVIIVNYNVKYFLEQCLISVGRASKGLDVETWMVDNDSMDGSVEMVRERFPWVKVIANKNNVGFSVANNQAMRQSDAEYQLLLNPDTVVEEDTFKKCIDFMDAHPNAGGLGVRMVDGKGKFLPESKRGLPTPKVAFYKIFGLASIFPKSKEFGQYHLGFLDEHENHKVDILAGAFMMMRKSVLDEIGLLDETFFMYGEDIDLSWRIRLAGYDNYYFSDTRIIHYKGESTKKGSLNYVFVFYRAMVIFAQKHFSQSHAGLFSLLINMAIYFRAALSIAKRFIQSIILPAFDFIGIWTVLYFLTHWYEGYSGNNYPDQLVQWALPLYSSVLILTTFISGGYDKPISILRIIKGMGLGLLTLLIIYALLSADYRFSRLIVIIGSLMGAGVLIGIRVILHLLNIKGYSLIYNTHKRIGIVSGSDEFTRIKTLLERTGVSPDFAMEINPAEHYQKRDYYIGKVSALPEIVDAFKLNELIFSLQDMSGDSIISQMGRLNAFNLEYKIAPPDSQFIIGSNSVNSPGEFYSFMAANNIGSPSNKRSKRLLDFSLSLILLIASPILAWMMHEPIQYFKNCFRVLFGLNTWVGYAKNKNQKKILPPIKKPIIELGNCNSNQNIPEEYREKINFNYANNYSINKDLQQIWKCRKWLGNKTSQSQPR